MPWERGVNTADARARQPGAVLGSKRGAARLLSDESIATDLSRKASPSSFRVPIPDDDGDCAASPPSPRVPIPDDDGDGSGDCDEDVLASFGTWSHGT